MARILVLVIFAALAAASAIEPGDSWAGDSLSGEKGGSHIAFRESSADRQVLSLAASGNYVCHADLSAAEVGASVCGVDKGNDHIDFRIGIDPDGVVCVNGEELTVCDPADGCRLALAWSGSGKTLVVQVTAADGALAAAQYYLEEAPTELRIAAADIRGLSITPQ
ncbi:MAG TPA: hypothetical protein VFY93_17115 [Planctomycetota bacterium]|nr:hypothetical protein [Planctomycetota bacterium]